MEEFYQTRERVAFCCNGGVHPNPNDYLSEKCFVSASERVFLKVLPDGKMHGEFKSYEYETDAPHKTGNLCFSTTSMCEFGIFDGSWSKCSSRLRCDGNFVNGFPHGTFTVKLLSEEVAVKTTVDYEMGTAVSHSHKGVGACELGCMFDDQVVSGDHDISWKFEGENVKISLSTRSKNKTREHSHLRPNSLKGEGKHFLPWGNVSYSLFCFSYVLPIEGKKFFHGGFQDEKVLIVP
uniref:Uncharacterized protein n=1 Tax=Marseillevirus sp. TaxID=2809551 RepID=A0AA96ENN5_9VIRU|nr:hypothetical protein MarFTMF_323 [Marseillevirus sp.]